MTDHGRRPPPIDGTVPAWSRDAEGRLLAS
jgi:hypothetical protein